MATLKLKKGNVYLKVIYYSGDALTILAGPQPEQQRDMMLGWKGIKSITMIHA